jgi:hypothetical protein
LVADDAPVRGTHAGISTGHPFRELADQEDQRALMSAAIGGSTIMDGASRRRSGLRDIDPNRDISAGADGMLNLMGDDPQYEAEIEAAINWAALEILDLTRLFECGRGYMPPGDTGPYLRGIIGWPFMSWALLSWLDAGLIQLAIEADVEPDEELRRFGWLSRAVPDRRWLILHAADARTLLSDTELWGVRHVTGQVKGWFSALGENAPPDAWHRVALASPIPPPPLGDDGPRQRAWLGVPEVILATEDWEALAVTWEFPAGGMTPDNPGRIVSRPRLYIVRRHESEGESWARVFAESEEQIRSILKDVDVWTERQAMDDDEISAQVQQLRKTVPISIENGLTLRRLT